MKNSVKFLSLCLVALFVMAGNSFAENIKEAKLKTNAHCGNCKTKIETGLNKIDGIKSTNVELKDKIATVSYDADIITPEKIKTSIVDMGYKADLQKTAEVKRSINDGKKSILNIIK